MPTVLRPNIAKVLLMSLFKILAGVVVIILILAILQFTVGLDLFTGLLDSFDIKLNTAFLLQGATIVVLGIAVLLMVYSYFAVVNLKYEFLDDRMVFQSSSAMVFKNRKEILYQNISRVSYDDKDFFNGLFHTGVLIVDLSSMGEKEVKMNYVDKPEEATNIITNILRAYNLKMQAEYTEKHQINDILNRGGL